MDPASVVLDVAESWWGVDVPGTLLATERNARGVEFW
jgi:hypothetical protein